MNIHFLILFCITIIMSPSFAQVTLTGVNGVSRYLEKQDNANATIYGGIAGPACVGANDNETCDNCADLASGQFFSGDSMTCNENRIYNTLYVTFSFTATSSGNAYLSKTDGVPIAGPVAVVAGESSTLQVDWNTLCELDEDITECEDYRALGEYHSETLYLGVDADNSATLGSGEIINVNLRISGPPDYYSGTQCVDTDEKGLCDMVIKPGDGKVYLDSISTLDSQYSPFTLSGDIGIEKVRIMYAQSFDELTPGRNYKDFDVIDSQEDKKDLSATILGGLSNNVAYVFGFANIDSAGNVSFFSDSLLLTNSCPSIGVSADMSTISDADIAACPYTAMPGEVVGLLKDDLNCFIATVAYGSSWDKHVVTFRKFRNTFLLTHSLGKFFVRQYYNYGKTASLWINNKTWAKPIVRVILWPIYLAVQFLLLIKPLGLFILMGLLMAFGIYRKLKIQKGYSF